MSDTIILFGVSVFAVLGIGVTILSGGIRPVLKVIVVICILVSTVAYLLRWQDQSNPYEESYLDRIQAMIAESTQSVTPIDFSQIADRCRRLAEISKDHNTHGYDFGLKSAEKIETDGVWKLVWKVRHTANAEDPVTTYECSGHQTVIESVVIDGDPVISDTSKSP